MFYLTKQTMDFVVLSMQFTSYKVVDTILLLTRRLTGHWLKVLLIFPNTIILLQLKH